MKNKEMIWSATKVRQCLYSYYICVALSALALITVGILSLFIYPIPQIGIPICLVFSLIWDICCYQVYVTRLKIIYKAYTQNEKNTGTSLPAMIKARTWIVFILGLAFLMNAGNFSFPLWLRVSFLAVTTISCLCSAIWHTDVYRIIYSILTQKEE